MKLKSISLLIVIIALMGFLVFHSATLARAEYPDKPIKIIVHSKAGGGTDVMSRTLWGHASEITGKTFIVENHPGAGGQIGYTKNATSRPDGYTVGAITTLSIVTHELTRKGVPYTLKGTFRPIARIVLDPSVAVVKPDSPYKTLDDLIKAAKKNPGKLSWGGTFLWGAHHIHYKLFEKATGAKMTYVPFDGAAETRANILGGHINVAAGGFSEYSQLVKEGKLRALALGAPEKWKDFPQVPTYKDLGYDIQIGSNRGFAVRREVPPECVKWLEDVLAKVVKDPAFLAKADKVNVKKTLAYLSGSDFEKYLHSLQNDLRIMLKDLKKK